MSYVFAKTGVNGIPARSGSTPGIALVTLRDFNGEGFVEGDTVTAYNAFDEAIGAGHCVRLAMVHGSPFVVAEAY